MHNSASERSEEADYQSCSIEISDIYMLYFEYCKISRVCRMYWDECRRHECQYPDQTSDISRIQV